MELWFFTCGAHVTEFQTIMMCPAKERQEPKMTANLNRTSLTTVRQKVKTVHYGLFFFNSGGKSKPRCSRALLIVGLRILLSLCIWYGHLHSKVDEKGETWRARLKTNKFSWHVMGLNFITEREESSLPSKGGRNWWSLVCILPWPSPSTTLINTSDRKPLEIWCNP